LSVVAQASLRHERVLVLPSSAADGAATRSILSDAGIDHLVCRDLAELLAALADGAAALVLTDDALRPGDGDRLRRAVSRQPPWSDLPILFLCARGADSPLAAWAFDALGNATIVERPIRITTLVSVLRSALRARRRQYEVRDGIERLRETDRRKDEFLAILAHELRNPLAPMMSALHVVQSTPSRDARQGRALAILDRQLHGLVRLVDDLLDVSRITRGRLELRRERVELGELLGAAVEAVQPQLAAAGHRLWLAPIEEPMPLDADPVRLVQVFANLLGNAVRYMPARGEIWLRAERREREVMVTIRDTGIGIPSDALARVFEPFVQLDAAAPAARGGLGVGLSLAKQLLELHGGRIDARSEGPGRGSEFVVWLPLAAGAAATAAPREQPRAAAPPLRILVADDNLDAAESLAMLLRLLGHDVRLAHDGEQALEQAEAFRPQLVLLDLGMPKLDGCAAARRLREHGWGRRATVAALTGWGDPDVKRRTAEAGFDLHLVKPLDRARLDDLLAQVAGARG
jgi:signal transduction histidine kinase/ActR/RegA family two-component response regulator